MPTRSSMPPNASPLAHRFCIAKWRCDTGSPPNAVLAKAKTTCACLVTVTVPTLYPAPAATQAAAYGGFNSGGFRARIVAERFRSLFLAPLERFPMVNRMQFYIDGAWVDPVVKKSIPVVNPATEEAMYEIAIGSKADVDKAAAAARRAFETYSQTSRDERVALLSKVVEIYKSRMKEIGAAVSDEMGAPLPMAEKLQAGAGLGHLMNTLEVLKKYEFEEPVGTAVVLREPVGVVGMITPWNWPLNQMTCKVAPALAAGCTMILKPSEFTPTSALIFDEILHEAGVPEGVFNLINGLGPEVGAAMSEHPDIDMISFTGSTRAGIDVAKRAAPTVKRVSQELGGKSPNVIL